MENFNQCLAIGRIANNAELSAYLNGLKAVKLPAVKNKIFSANSKAALVQAIQAAKDANDKLKERNLEKKRCYDIIDSLIKGDKNTKRVISPADLIPKLEALKASIEQENKFSKVDALIEKSGMSREQLIEYLNR